MESQTESKTYQGYENIIDFFSPGWSTTEVEGTTFDQYFHIGNIPLSWFLRRQLTSHSIPSVFNTQLWLTQKKVKPKIPPFILAKLFYFNERRKLAREEKQVDGNQKVLFHTFTNHIKNGKIFRLDSIIKKLDNPLIIAADPLSNFKSNSQDSYSNIYDFVNPSIIKESKKLAHTMHQKWKKLNIKQKIFSNVDLWNFIKHPLNFYMSKEFLFIIHLYYLTWQKILSKSNIPCCVLSSANSISEKCLLAAASKKEIPCLVLQHGTGGGIINPDVIGNSKIAVFSEYYKERYIAQGVDPNSIEIVGPIMFDDVIKFKQDSIEEKKTAKNILILTVPLVEGNFTKHEEYFSYISSLLSSISKFNIPVTIKTHPREKYQKDYQKIITDNNWSQMKVVDKSLKELISKATVVIEFGSSAAFEAMILDKPVITTNFNHLTFGNCDVIKQSKGTYDVDWREDISTTIKMIFENDPLKDKRKEAVEKICGNIDGRSTDKVVKLIKEMTTKEWTGN